jgi:hypothetical protein
VKTHTPSSLPSSKGRVACGDYAAVWAGGLSGFGGGVCPERCLLLCILLLWRGTREQVSQNRRVLTQAHLILVGEPEPYARERHLCQPRGHPAVIFGKLENNSRDKTGLQKKLLK